MNCNEIGSFVTKLKGKSKAKIRKQNQLRSEIRFEAYKNKLLSKIKKYDDEFLLKRCENVDIEEDLSFLRSIGKVLAATENGIGLAANQIGINKRVFAVRINYKINDIYFIINPEVIDYSEETKEGLEACLSYPGISTIVKRYKKVKLKYINEKKDEVIETFEGIESIIIQHEMDHLDKESYCEVGKVWCDSKNIK